MMRSEKPETGKDAQPALETSTLTIQGVVRTPRPKLARETFGWVIVLVAGFAAPYVLSSYSLRTLVQGATLGLLALSVGWLLRQTGLASFGHAAFSGLAGYTAALGALRWGIPTPLALLLAVVASASLAFVVGAIVVRASGIAFGMLTLAIGQLIYVASTNMRSLTNGFDGLVASFPGDLLGRPATTFINAITAWPLVWSVLMLAVACLWWLSRSMFGRRLAAIRENEERCAFAGEATFLPRVLAFSISGVFAGAAGALNVLTLGLVSTDDVAWTASGLALIVAIIGGVRSLAGPLIGAMAFVVLQTVMSGSSHYQVIIGVALILVVAVAPGGLTALTQRASERLRLIGRSSSNA